MVPFLSALPRRSRLSPVDTAWLRMDSASNLMMIVGVQVLDGPCDLPRLRRLIQDGLLRLKPFRCRVVQDPSGAWWEEMPHFDIDQHLVRLGLPGDSGKEELQALVGTLAAQSLDPGRPLWQFHVVENYREGDWSGHALIVRIHHCIADGIALIRVLLSMTSTDEADDGRRPGSHAAAGDEPGQSGADWAQLLQPFTRTAVGFIERAGDAAVQVLRAGRAVIDNPDQAGAAATQYAGIAAQAARDAAALALMDDDTRTSLKGRPGGSKAVAWNEPLPLARIKAVGKALGCSVNDVLLACAAGALRAYLEERGEDLDGAELRAMVPVNLRAAAQSERLSSASLGNKFGLVPLLLPIGIADPADRVREVQRRMNELKGGYTAVLAMAVLGLAGLAPRFLQRQALDLLARKATAVMTNVPGPQQTLYMAGSQVRQLMFWVPQSGDIGVGVSILSYDGAVQFGLITDKVLCAHPQQIIDRFAPEFALLERALSPVGGHGESVRPRAGRSRKSSGRKTKSAIPSTGTSAGAPASPSEAGPATESQESGRGRRRRNSGLSLDRGFH